MTRMKAKEQAEAATVAERCCRTARKFILYRHGTREGNFAILDKQRMEATYFSSHLRFDIVTNRFLFPHDRSATPFKFWIVVDGLASLREMETVLH